MSLCCTQYTKRGHGSSLRKDSNSISLLPIHQRAVLGTERAPSCEQGQKSQCDGSTVCISIHHHITSDSKAARCPSLTGISFHLGTFLLLQHSCQNQHSQSRATHSRMGEAKTPELEESSLRQSQGHHKAPDSGKWNRIDRHADSFWRYVSMFLITSSLLRRRACLPHSSLIHPSWRYLFCTS